MSTTNQDTPSLSSDKLREIAPASMSGAFLAKPDNHILLPDALETFLPVSPFSYLQEKTLFRFLQNREEDLPIKKLEQAIIKMVSFYTILTKEHLFLFLSAKYKYTKKLFDTIIRDLVSYGYLSVYRYKEEGEDGLYSPVFYAPSKKGLSIAKASNRLSSLHEDEIFCMDTIQILTLAQLNQWHISMLFYYRIPRNASIYRGKVTTAMDTFGYVGSFFHISRKQVPSLTTPSLSIVAIPFSKELKTGHFLKSAFSMQRASFINEMVTAAAFLSYHKDKLPYSMIILLVDDKESAIFARKLLDSYSDLKDSDLFFLFDYDSMKDPLASIAQVSINDTKHGPSYDFSFLSLI